MQHNPKHFQRVTLYVGGSARHERDIGAKGRLAPRSGGNPLDVCGLPRLRGRCVRENEEQQELLPLRMRRPPHKRRPALVCDALANNEFADENASAHRLLACSGSIVKKCHRPPPKTNRYCQLPSQPVLGGFKGGRQIPDLAIGRSTFCCRYSGLGSYQ